MKDIYTLFNETMKDDLESQSIKISLISFSNFTKKFCLEKFEDKITIKRNRDGLAIYGIFFLTQD